MADGSLGDSAQIELDPATGVVITPASTAGLGEFAAAHEASLTQILHHHGAVLFRGWGVRTAEEFRDAVAAMWGAAWAEYREPGTPRSRVIANISTSTEYDAASPIHLHNENSHVITWPERLFFWCEQPATTGGATPLADVRAVLARLPDALRSRGEKHGILYQRSFGHGLGFSWQQVFETEDPVVAENYFRHNGMTWEWEGPTLRVRYRRNAVATHPTTGQDLWFNHAVIYSPFALPPDQRVLLEQFSVEEMPFCTYWGDGSLITEAEVGALMEAYDACTRATPWEAGDLLMVDNMLVAHGRRPYAGPRRVLVAMRGTVSVEGRVSASAPPVAPRTGARVRRTVPD